MSARDVVITGIGLVSSAGEGLEPHLDALRSGAPPALDMETFAPFGVQPVPAIVFDTQIPKKSDQRQMELWQKLGVYAAGMALDSAGIKDDAQLKAAMHLIVAAGGGERDYAVDGQILTQIEAAAPEVFLNERLMGDVRPTLFLAQLSNLLAGNISIVHGVTGASRTFMGEEQSGVDAIRIAHARIRSGQNDIFLVGGSYNAQRPDVLLIYEMGGFLWKKPFAPVFDRPGLGGGFIPGSAGAFLVLEAREHAQRRGATALAAIDEIGSDRRVPGSVAMSLENLWGEVRPGSDAVVVSGASGVAVPTQEEHEALAKLAPGARVHATGDIAGHAIEAQAPMSVALAAGLIAAGDAPEAVVTSVGHWRGEGVIRLSKAD
jgi:3-oxoacyl-[acyl-carrier-protein] synthase II